MSDLIKLEQDIEECRKLISTADALEGLRKNRLFKTLIEEGYLSKEAVRNTLNLDYAHLREGSIRALAGISSFNAYLQTIEQAGEIARNTLVELLDEQTRMLAGE